MLSNQSVYDRLVANGAATNVPTLARQLSSTDAEVQAVVDSSLGCAECAFIDNGDGTYSANPAYVPVVAPAINSLAELFAVGGNPDELAIFLRNPSVVSTVTGESSHYCYQLANHELPELVAKFGLDLGAVPAAAEYVEEIQTKFRNIGALLDLFKAEADSRAFA